MSFAEPWPPSRPTRNQLCSRRLSDGDALTAHCSLPTAHYSLLTAHCPLLTAHLAHPSNIHSEPDVL
jgi:hypothetical protein